MWLAHIYILFRSSIIYYEYGYGMVVRGMCSKVQTSESPDGRAMNQKAMYLDRILERDRCSQMLLFQFDRFGALMKLNSASCLYLCVGAFHDHRQ